MAIQPKPHFTRLTRRLFWFTLLVLAAIGVFAVNAVIHDNFHAIAPGVLYRSGQMNSNNLGRVVRQHGIKSVINLRGDGGDKDWYLAETNTASQLGARYFTFGLSADREVTDQEIQQILAVMATAPKPMLIHCRNGADRSGLVGALYLYYFQGQTPKAASSQLSAYYGHFPHLFWNGTVAMDRSYWRYVNNHGPQAIPATATASSASPLVTDANER